MLLSGITPTLNHQMVPLNHRKVLSWCSHQAHQRLLRNHIDSNLRLPRPCSSSAVVFSVTKRTNTFVKLDFIIIKLVFSKQLRSNGEAIIIWFRSPFETSISHQLAWFHGNLYSFTKTILILNPYVPLELNSNLIFCIFPNYHVYS